MRALGVLADAASAFASGDPALAAGDASDGAVSFAADIDFEAAQVGCTSSINQASEESFQEHLVVLLRARPLAVDRVRRVCEAGVWPIEPFGAIDTLHGWVRVFK
jgi:hypothetical protein